MTVQMTFTEAYKIMTETPNSQLVLLPKRQHMKLSPKYIGSVNTGVSELLKSQLSLLNRELDGVPVAFKNIKAIQRLGRVISDQPCLHFDIEAEFILFKPAVGCVLKGVINKVGKKHVGCLVLGCFNAWFPRSEVKVPPDTDLLTKEVEFTVLEVFSNNRVVSLKGKFHKLVSELDPSKGVIDETELDSTLTDSISNEMNSSSMVPIMTSTQIETPGASSKKHKKHRRSKHEDANTPHQAQACTALVDSVMSPVGVNGDIDSFEETSIVSNSKKKKKKDRKEADKEICVKEEGIGMPIAVDSSRKHSKRKLELLEVESGNSSMEFVSPKKKVKNAKHSMDNTIVSPKKHKKSKKKKIKPEDD